MCGISGIIDKKVACSDVFKAGMLDLLKHRGPDENGIFEDEWATLFHSRLSIIGLEDGQQPMMDPVSKVVIIFNGEIYNYRSLKVKLTDLGYTFRTHSDTEVILNGFLHYGEDIFNMLDGMFALAIYDTKNKRCILARDKFGEKPLYYAFVNQQLVFGSELKSLTYAGLENKISQNALDFYLSLTYIPAPYTIYESAFKLKQGSYLIYQDGTVDIKTYYDINDEVNKVDHPNSYEEAKNILRNKMFEAVESRMVSDVPCGAFLSGGIDSSIVTSIMSSLSDKPVDTFSIGFSLKSFDESERAKKVAQYCKTNHHTFFLDYGDVVADLDLILSNLDEPFGDSSIIPSYVVSKFARQTHKVVLTGDGGDEVFAGYSKYLLPYYRARYNRIPEFVRESIIKPSINRLPTFELTRNILRKAKKVVNSSDGDFYPWYELMALGYKDSMLNQLLASNLGLNNSASKHVKEIFDSRKATGLNQVLLTDLNVVLEGDMLCKVDRASMMNSLETRVPILAPAVVEYAFSLNDEYKINGKSLKYIFKDTFKDMLPDGIINLSKRGFGVPVGEWLKRELLSELKDVSRKEFLEEQGIFNYSYIQSLIDDHVIRKIDRSFQLWTYYVFQKWYINNC